MKEHQIATEVFGRPGTFDPRLDAIVRVQTGRLRHKLQGYYAGPGSDDPVLLEVPRGSYSLTAQPRATAMPKSVTVTAPFPVASVETPKPAGTRVDTNWRMNLLLVFSGLSLAVLILVGYRAIAPHSAAAVGKVEPATVAPLITFWKAFTAAGDAPMLVYSNAVFVGRPETGMRYFDELKDSRTQVMDHYTGVGEVVAACELSRAFALLGAELRIKRGRLLTLDDAKNYNLIFVGSPSENLSLQELPGSRDFHFRRGEVPQRAADLAIVNVKPAPGEQRVFAAAPTHSLKYDYALISLTPGLVASRKVLILAGTTTFGTQAAVEFVSRGNTLEQLLAKLPDAKREVSSFEAVLKVKISGGVPVQSQLVAFHRLT